MLIDVSSNNGTPDWAKVKSNNPDLRAMLKANEGYGCMDSKFVYNATQCHLLGIPFGVYHFATLNKPDVVPDATQEANYFLTRLNDIPEAKLPLCIDIETNAINLPAPKVVLWAKTFLDVLKQAGKTNLSLYSGLSFLQSNHFDIKDFPNIKLWLAEYNNKIEPLMPAGLPDYWAWQYTAEGSVVGIQGHVDISKLKVV